VLQDLICLLLLAGKTVWLGTPGGDRRLGGPVLLGGRTSPGPSTHERRGRHLAEPVHRQRQVFSEQLRLFSSTGGRGLGMVIPLPSGRTRQRPQMIAGCRID
jgi:hypothetical protein